VSSLLGELGSISLNSLGEAIAFAAGYGARDAIAPPSAAIGQKAWSLAPIRALDPHDVAALAAENSDSPYATYVEAMNSGINQDRFEQLVELAQRAPAIAMALELWRRDEITEDDVTVALNKAYLPELWHDPIKALKEARLAPAQIALGIVRSVIADPGLLAVSLDTSDSNVARYPVAGFDALAEAAAAGIDEDRLRTLVGEIGLPMSAQQAASAYFRDIITKGAFNQAILEGDTRPEWAAAILEQARQIPTAHDFIEGHLRTWIDEAAMYAGAARHGMSEADAELVFNITGRPLPVHQITKGKARGGSYDGPTDQIPADFLKAIAESNVRPEWYELDYLANQYTWPSYFVLKPLTAAGTITVEECASILEWSGWQPELAAKTAASFTSSGSSSKQPTEAQLAAQYEAGQIDRATYVADLEARGYSSTNAEKVAQATDGKPLISARTAILSKLRAGVVAGGITPEQAAAELAKTTVAPATIPQLVAAWQHEHEIEHPPAAATA